MRRSPSGFMGCGRGQTPGQPIDWQSLQSEMHAWVIERASFVAVLKVSQSSEHADPTQYSTAGAPADVSSNVTEPPLHSVAASGGPPPCPPEPPTPESGDPAGGVSDVEPPQAHRKETRRMKA